jgi:hypothetical protein
MNKSWIVAGLFAVAGTIVLTGCDGGSRPAVVTETKSEAGRVNVNGETEWDGPPDLEFFLRVIKETEYLRNAGMWANCDPASTYPRKDPTKCNVTHIELVSDDE